LLEDDFLRILSEAFSAMLHNMITILIIMWPLARALLLAVSAILIMIGLVAWAISEERRILLYSLIMHLIVLLLDSILT